MAPTAPPPSAPPLASAAPLSVSWIARSVPATSPISIPALKFQVGEIGVASPAVGNPGAQSGMNTRYIPTENPWNTPLYSVTWSAMRLNTPGVWSATGRPEPAFASAMTTPVLGSVGAVGSTGGFGARLLAGGGGITLGAGVGAGSGRVGAGGFPASDPAGGRIPGV